MKKFRLPMILLAFTALVFIACTKDDKILIAQEAPTSSLDQNVMRIDQNLIPLKDYGFYHNEGLSLYYGSQKGIKQTNPDLIFDKIYSLLQSKYPNGFKNVNLNEIKSTFSATNPQMFNMVTYWNSNKESLFLTGKLSRKIGVLVDYILINNLDYDQFTLEIQNFKKNNVLSSKELDSLVVFESVLQSSNQFWSLKNKISSTSKHGSKAIVADGLGALMFCYSGPGSIIAGCICSLFVNESQAP